MAQKPKLRTHTHMDISLVKEMQHVVDRVLVPNCIRKTQAFYLGIGVLCLGIGAGSVLASGQLVVGAIFGLLGLAMLGWGAMAYHIAARKTYRQMEKAVPTEGATSTTPTPAASGWWRLRRTSTASRGRGTPWC